MLRSGGDKDPYLRHAAVMGLAASGKTAAWAKAIHDESAAVRMGVLLALRRLHDPEIARFLTDPDPRLVLEAARAIHDVPIEPALPALASLSVPANVPLPLLRRILSASFRLGRAENAARMAAVAERSELPAAARVLALELLAQWGAPSGRDPVIGLWRPISGPAGGAGVCCDRAQARRAHDRIDRKGANRGNPCCHGARNQRGRRSARGARG